MIYNKTGKCVLAKMPFFAERWQDRLRGMIARRFDSFDAMVFRRCNAVHTFFMSMPLDVLFVGKDGTVLKKVRHLRPWHPCAACRSAVAVIELPADTASAEAGDQLGFE